MKHIFILVLAIQSISAFSQENLQRSIYFQGGSFYIDEEQSAALRHWLDSIPNLLDKFQIQLISHTDPIGGKMYNEWLSKMRSTSVRELLVEFDIPDQIIHTKDWGLEKPDYSNDTYRGMAMNRRVDVVLHPIVF